jgi:acylphosphatase
VTVLAPDKAGRRVVRLLVSGRVQGIGYRYFTRQTARRLGLAGWVRNLDDGSVEIHAEGDAASLVELEAALRKGPSGARVDDVRQLPADPLRGLTTSFDIIR